MRLKKSESTGLVTINMTPMIDMVFNLLIFFILTSQFVKLEIEDVVLPISTTCEFKDYTQYKNIVINIVNPDNPQIVVFGQVRTPLELTAQLKEFRGDTSSESTNVILRADADIPYEDVARVMLATGAAEIRGWWITTEREKTEKKS
jgi:biopolymer transport protein ExbD